MTDTEPTVDLGAVQWEAEEQADRCWHLVAIEDQPDGYGEVIYDLRVERATDHRGNDLSAVVAEAIARRLDGWNHDIDQAERDAYGRGFDAGRDVQDARWRVAAKDRDAEHRLNLEVALGWDLPENPDDKRDEPPTWAEIITAVKAMRDARAAVAPEVVAAAFGVTDPDEPIDGKGGWMPATSQLLRNLAEHGLKVVRA